ncbi:MAG: radical SAM family heme chaperone HemW [Deltaproteobacteria bacterium]|nr:radical SAM family heme chaperone HemW [Deltaproteobacteria bacterium]MBT4524974.1 radical SAM family heme chaperone HemW [Deltaproteobacteria bacterium]
MLPKFQTLNGIYLHMPFCKSICPFCAFSVLPDQPKKHANYLHLIQNELALLEKELQADFSKTNTVYLGGGTPSLIAINELKSIMDRLKSLVTNPACQWSIEINPEDGNLKYLENLVSLGFNRFSIGIQSFNPATLESIQRNHTVKHCHSVLNRVQQINLTDFNVDIMFGIPGQTIHDLEKDLCIALEYDPTHISAYILNIEPKTKLNRKPEWRKWQIEHESLIAEQYKKVIEILSQNGLQQYEVSNFSKPGFESKQNIINWKGKYYLGIGLGAHSFINNCRWGNFRRWKEYQQNLKKEDLPIEFFDPLTISQLRDEYLMINLRLIDGINLDIFKTNFNCKLEQYCQKTIDQMKGQGLIILQNNQLKLSTNGMLLTDEITLKLCTMLPD